ncbi:pentapeptide repeat-containing protein [Streptosporangium canum]|uniref:pentapeptide repeat-containing protein n=1 Tax=Streptosporangium canum TaxID=324952 RepID=UPI00379973E5
MALIVGIAVFAASYGIALWLLPDWMNIHVPDPAKATPDQNHQIAQERHNARLLVIAIGGAVVLVTGLLYTARNYALAHRGQLTDRLIKALERLGSTELDVRLGGVYTLQHLLRESRAHHDDIVEILNAFIRRQAPPADSAFKSTALQESERWIHPPALGHDHEPLPDKPSADVQAALTVIATRPDRQERRRIDLSGLHLAGAALHRARLHGANLSKATLTQADFGKSMLSEANFHEATLTGADFGKSMLSEANFYKATLTGANFEEAKAVNASFERTTLIDTSFDGATLTHTSFDRATLTGTHFDWAKLTYTHFNGATLIGTHFDWATLIDTHFNGAELTSTYFDRAKLISACFDKIKAVDVRFAGMTLNSALPYSHDEQS